MRPLFCDGDGCEFDPDLGHWVHEPACESNNDHEVPTEEELRVKARENPSSFLAWMLNL